MLDRSSPVLHLDEHMLPMHGVPWPLLPWVVTEARQDFMAAQLEWCSSNLLAGGKLVDNRRATGLVCERAKVPFRQDHRLRCLRHSYRGGLCRWESLIGRLVDEEQFGPKRIPSDRQRDDTYTDNEITHTHR